MCSTHFARFNKIVVSVVHVLPVLPEQLHRGQPTAVAIAPELQQLG